MTSKYGRKLEYSERSLRAAGSALASLRTRLRALGGPPPDGSWAGPTPLVAGSAGDRPLGIAVGPSGHGDGVGYSPHDRAGDPMAQLSPAGRDLHDRFVAAIDDDLDMPVALALLREIVRAPLPPEERRWLVLDADLVLGLDLHRVWQDEPGAPAAVPEAIASLIAQRAAARLDRDFARSDALRDELAGLGWEVVDGPERSTVRRRQ